MQKLEKQIKLTGTGQNVTATQLNRINDICIYERDDEVFEVFQVKVAEAKKIFDKSYEEREVYPNNEDFGKTAWCYKTKESAIKKFTKLLNKVEL